MRILKVIEKKSSEDISFGRGSLFKDPDILPMNLTEYRLKKHIQKLIEQGLISVGATKQGMRITEKGQAYIYNQPTL